MVIQYPHESLIFWEKRFKDLNITSGKIEEKFNEIYLTVSDPDNLRLELIVPQENEDMRTPWTTPEVSNKVATKGFYNATLTTNNVQPTADLLTGVLGYRFLAQEGNIHRFISNNIDNAAVIDLLELPSFPVGHVAGGSVHHIAFRVENEEVLIYFREKILNLGYNITEKIDRNYFYSLYFREPGGVLFELATDNPGFDVDEPLSELGSNLKLPPQYESRRDELVKKLPSLT